MIWAWILVGIGVVMLISLVCWTIWLAHKASDVYHQLIDLGGKVGKLAEQVERLDLSPLDQPHPRAGDLPGSVDRQPVSGSGTSGNAAAQAVRSGAPHPRHARG